MKEGNYYYDKVDDMFKIFASKDYEKGEEVMITYLGVRSGSNYFLATYLYFREDLAYQTLVYSIIMDSSCLLSQKTR